MRSSHRPFLCSLTASVALSAVLLLSACVGSPTVSPARTAGKVEGMPGAATATVSGITAVVRTRAWDAYPPNLADVVTPLHVRIENAGEHPLRIRYADIRFSAPALDYSPLPPYKLVDYTVTVTSPDPVMVPRDPDPDFRFRVAPYRYPDFPERVPWTGPWKMDAGYYDAQYPKWQEPLPTLEMVQLALVEGVLEPGGHVDGFLYFEKIPRHVRDLTFQIDLVDAQTELGLGFLRIPFVNR